MKVWQGCPGDGHRAVGRSQGGKSLTPNKGRPSPPDAEQKNA